jgi:starch phosphorylase
LSMAELTPRFSANRMVRQYVESLYLPAADAYRERVSEGARPAKSLHQWRQALQAQWKGLRFGRLEVEERKGYFHFQVPVYLGTLDPGAIQVQLYADPQSGTGAQVYPMKRGKQISSPDAGFTYRARIKTKRPANDFTPRIIPSFDGASVPLEANQILWQH